MCEFFCSCHLFVTYAAFAFLTCTHDWNQLRNPVDIPSIEACYSHMKTLVLFKTWSGTTFLARGFRCRSGWSSPEGAGSVSAGYTTVSVIFGAQSQSSWKVWNLDGFLTSNSKCAISNGWQKLKSDMFVCLPFIGYSSTGGKVKNEKRPWILRERETSVQVKSSTVQEESRSLPETLIYISCGWDSFKEVCLPLLLIV